MEAARGAYRRSYDASVQDPETFWLSAATAIDWDRAPQRALDDSRAPHFAWFPDATLNTCFNALDRHVIAGRGAQTALIYDSAVTGVQRHYSYAELLDQVSRFAGVLRGVGIERGDRVIIYLPMIPEALVAMLACARIGAVHSVVFGGFAATELAVRIDDSGASAVVTASGGIEPGRLVEYLPIVAKALTLSAGSARSVIVKARTHVPGSAADYSPGGTTPLTPRHSSDFASTESPVRWLDWDQQLADAPHTDPVLRALHRPHRAQGHPPDRP